MAVDKRFYRVVDANLNRLQEALRVSEDITRYILDSAALVRSLKSARHAVSKLIESRPAIAKRLHPARSISTDVGRPTRKFEIKRRDYSDLLYANLERAKESLRVLEEFSKLIDKDLSEVFKSLRYKLYEIEKRSSKIMASLRYIR